MERMLLDQEKDGFFRKAGRHANYHKNLFTGLAYFHANLGGRRRYGTLGWHLPYQFDFGDFEVSNAQLREAMKRGTGDLIATLDTLKYFYAHINYAGRVHRTEDQVTLNAILDDLINDELAFVPELAADLGASHHGFPPAGVAGAPVGEGVDYFGFFDRAIPARDSYQLYGFNWTIESRLLRSEIFGLLDRMHLLNRKWASQLKEDEWAGDLRASIEQSSLQASLRSGASESGALLRAQLGEKESLLNLFGGLQKLLSASSLDRSAIQRGERYDHQTDQATLPQRDLHDQKVVELAERLSVELDAQLDLRLLDERFPVRYKTPLNNVVNRELNSYRRLLAAIREAVEGLVATVNATHRRPHEVEALWTVIQANRIPDAWLRLSFETAHASLSDFLVELCLRLKYWRELAADPSPAPEGPTTYWLRAFYEPRALLRALLQTRARTEGIPLSELRNELEVLDDSKPCAPEPHVVHLSGLALEGAEWEPRGKQLVDVTGSRRFSSFPGLRVKTVRVGRVPGLSESLDEAAATLAISVSQAADPSKTSGFGRPKPADDDAPVAEPKPPVQSEFRCPVYCTTLRLSEGKVARTAVPVASVKLPTMEKPSAWIKRGVALVLEADL
jgi:hypothetical protein